MILQKRGGKSQKKRDKTSSAALAFRKTALLIPADIHPLGALKHETHGKQSFHAELRVIRDTKTNDGNPSLSPAGGKSGFCTHQLQGQDGLTPSSALELTALGKTAPQA